MARLQPVPDRKKWPLVAVACAVFVLLVAAGVTLALRHTEFSFIKGDATLAPASYVPAAGATVPSTTVVDHPLVTAPQQSLLKPALNSAAGSPSHAQMLQAQAKMMQARMMNDQLSAPSRIHQASAGVDQAPPPAGVALAASGMEGPAQAGALGNVLSNAHQPNVQAGAPRVVRVSAGVAFGMLVRQTPPVYPKIARDARVSGTVVLDAYISKTGAIEYLRVVSGPEMLRQSALDAVRTWRYRPTKIDNMPTEVETTINVAFTLSN